MPIILTVIKGDDSGKVFRVNEGQSCVIGRSSEADISIEDISVSRKHCLISFVAGVCSVADLGSRNGTFVNGQRVRTSTGIADGDVLWLGLLQASVHFEPDRLFNPEELIGKEIAGCRIDSLAGCDETTCSYRAVQLSMERPVLLRFLNSSAGSSQSSVALFISDARACGKLSHPNIVRIYEASAVEKYCFAIMEYVDGKSVRELAGDPLLPLDLHKALEIAEQIAGALDYAHSASYLHGRLNADTIVVTEDGVAKLSCFSLRPVSKTKMDETFETQFIAPEILSGGLATAQSDLYALGIVLYIMVTGRVPFDAGDRAEVEEMILSGRHERLKKSKNVPPAVVAVIENALVVSESERYACAADMRAALLQVRQRSV